MPIRGSRKVTAVLTLVGLALAAGGCGADGTSPTPSDGDQPAGEPIVIGLSTPLSGTLAGVGEHNKWGAELAVKQANAAGGVLERPLELVAQDNACNPAEGVSVARKLAGDPGTVGILGAFCSSVTLATMPVVKESEIPLVIGVSSTPDITEMSGVGGNDWSFRISPSDTDMAVALADYLAENRDFTSVSYVAEDTDYGRGGAEALKKALAKAGVGEAASTDYFAQGTTDFTTILAKVRGAEPDALAIFAVGADDVNFAKQYLASGLTDVALTGRPALDLYGQEGLLETGQFDDATGVMQYAAGVDTPKNKSFVEEFESEFGQLPVVQSFHGYVQAQVLIDAIKRAGSTDRNDIRAALEETNLPSPLGGTITFDEHNQAYDNTVVRGVQDGKEVVLGVVPTGD